MEVISGYEKQRDRMNRRRFISGIVLGAGALAAVAIPSQWKASHGEPNMAQDGSEYASESIEKYPVHENIMTTIFWIGEEASPDNDHIHNNSSAWVVDWEASFGGEDDPKNRCGYKPCGFTPHENPFYVALPFGDYTENGLKPSSELQVVPWYEGAVPLGQSILKNRWVEILYKAEKVYAQWQDVGPFIEDDAGYVFGQDEPKDPRAGLDVSPAVADYLGLSGKDRTSWRFVDEAEVPPGPWREIITTSGPAW